MLRDVPSGVRHLDGRMPMNFLVVARNDDRADAFIVARDAEGVSISEPELNMGLKGLTTVSVELEASSETASRWRSPAPRSRR